MVIISLSRENINWYSLSYSSMHNHWMDTCSDMGGGFSAKPPGGKENG